MSVIETLAKLDWLISSDQVAEHAGDLPELLRNRAVRTEFYSKLSDPGVLSALHSAGCFRRGAGRIRGSLIPELEYLARTAAEEPELVSQILSELRVLSPQERRLFLLVLKSLPAHVGVVFCPRVLRWVSDGRGLEVWQGGLAQYVLTLAHGGCVREAMMLVRRAIGFESDQQGLGAPSTRLPAPWYESFVTEVVPSLSAADGMGTLRLLCAVLDSCLSQLKQIEQRNGELREDLSWMWRPAIEDHEQNEPEDPRGVLISQVRDLGLILAASSEDAGREVLGVLGAKPWRLFVRLSLHILRVHRAPLDLVRARLVDRSLFDDSGVLHEYYHLLHDCFPLLSPDDQAVILTWIDGGPSMDEDFAWFTERQGKRPSDGQIADYCDSWRLKKLMPISDYLPEDWKERLDKLAARFGPPEHPDLPVYRGTWVGPTSPLTLEDIRAMEPVELMQHLRKWVPPREWDAPTPEGLGRLVAAAVADDPSRYTSVLGALSGIEATYVRSFFEGLRQAVESKKTFEWALVLDLAKEVVHSPWSTPSPSGPVHDRDSDWGSTRKTIAAMIEAGLETGVSEIPISSRRTVWQILEPLADDSDPAPEDERRYGEGGFDAVTMSINTVRGRAMHAVVKYGLWVMRQAAQTQDKKEGFGGGAAVVPEVWPILDDHLDVARDPSLAVRSVYGQWFPWIHLLGHDWAASRLEKIFPREPQQAPWWTAAWIGYVMYARPFDDVLAVLLPVYRRAVHLMTPDEEPLLFGDRPSERLGEHLVTYAWRAKISVDPIDPLLEGYWSKADGGLRRHVLSYIGRSLREWLPAELDPGVPPALERLKVLWAFVLSKAAGQPGNDEETSELSAFAWWFSSGRFDDDWAFGQLELVLRKTSLLDEAHLVAERLAKVADAQPLRSVRVLDKLVQSDREGWRITGWKDKAQKVLEVAMRSGDEEVHRASVRLINRLVSKGYLEFRGLVDSEPTHGGERTS